MEIVIVGYMDESNDVFNYHNESVNTSPEIKLVTIGLLITSFYVSF